MKVLVINSGSSSIKFQLMNPQSGELLAKGLLERLGSKQSVFKYTVPGREKLEQTLPLPDHRAGLAHLLKVLTDPVTGVMVSLDEVDAVGHRIVHGGERIKQSVVLDKAMIEVIENISHLAPLHNPANLQGVEALQSLMPAHVKHVGVFDTAFFAGMPAANYLYALPHNLSQKHGLRRFGFHGTSHQYVSLRMAELLGKQPDDCNVIVAHLGNGSSLSAVRGGVAVDTTLGFGTMCGVPMGTRSGDVDPAIILHLLDKLHYTTAQVHDILYKESGLLGVSGISNDARDILTAAAADDAQAKLAVEAYGHQVARGICGLACNFDHLDAVVFTAGIGENSAGMRAAIAPHLRTLGARFDKASNDFMGEERCISTPDSPVPIWVVPTNEELMIARETQRLAGGE